MIVLSPVLLHAGEKFKPRPDNTNLKPVTVDGVTWTGNLAGAIEQAVKEKKLIFIDFTGVTCVNCRINEKTVFAKEEVKDLFKKFVCVQIHVDSVPETLYTKPPIEEKREQDAELNLAFQKKTFGTEQLPLYVIVKPAENNSFEVVAIYAEGKINKLDQFIEFMKKPLKD